MEETSIVVPVVLESSVARLATVAYVSNTLWEGCEVHFHGVILLAPKGAFVWRRNFNASVFQPANSAQIVDADALVASEEALLFLKLRVTFGTELVLFEVVSPRFEICEPHVHEMLLQAHERLLGLGELLGANFNSAVETKGVFAGKKAALEVRLGLVHDQCFAAFKAITLEQQEYVTEGPIVLILP